jgi:inosose dehydratase
MALEIERRTAGAATSRRGFLFAASSGVLMASQRRLSRLSVEGYIWQQYAERQGKPLKAVVGEALSMARQAGFHNVELNQAYFTPDLQAEVVAALKLNRLLMPSVYVGGVMHEPKGAEQTISLAVEVGGICRPFGCVAIVHNPSPKPAGAEKTDEELKFQSEALNRMGRTLKAKGFQLRVHHHTPEMASNAREWRYILKTTDPNYVWLCMDLDWVHQGGRDPLALLKEAGTRVAEVHVRNSKDKLWLESFEPGDVDYSTIARYFDAQHLQPLIVVELAYRRNTVITRPLREDLRLSRIYAEKVFGVRA